MTEPFLKWVGGKRQLLDRITQRLPEKINRYYEPFFGGGSVFFHLGIKHSTINDINKSLMNTYTQVRDFPDEVMELLSTYDEVIVDRGKDYYYEQRDLFNKKLVNEEYDIEMSSLFIFINKHCFNGVYRVNSKGLYNVPYNNSTGKSFDRDNILSVSSSLKNTKIMCGDFEVVCDDCKEGDFIYFDSPYVPLNDTSFESYTKEGFSKENHIRLSELYKRLSEKGCNCMLSNHNTPFVQELYKDFRVEVVDVKRYVNSDSSNRKGEEVIITNYDFPDIKDEETPTLF